MAKITRDDVLHVAKLAKLTLTSTEVDKFTGQLEKVLEHISELDNVDIKNVEPTAQTTGLTNVLREDVIDVTKCLPQDKKFMVPQILQK